MRFARFLLALSALVVLVSGCTSERSKDASTDLAAADTYAIIVPEAGQDQDLPPAGALVDDPVDNSFDLAKIGRFNGLYAEYKWFDRRMDRMKSSSKELEIAQLQQHWCWSKMLTQYHQLTAAEKAAVRSMDDENDWWDCDYMSAFSVFDTPGLVERLERQYCASLVRRGLILESDD